MSLSPRLIALLTTSALSLAPLGLAPLAAGVPGAHADEAIPTVSSLDAKVWVPLDESSWGTVPFRAGRPIAYGTELDFGGAVSTPDGQGVEHGTTYLQVRTAADSAWTTDSRADAPGTFAFHYYRPTGSAQYRVLYTGHTAAAPGEVSYAPSTSTPITINLSRAIEVKVPGRRLFGTVSPDYRGEVRILRKVGTQYAHYRTVRTNERSRFSIRLPDQAGPKLRLRFRIPGDSTFARTVADHTVRR